MHVRMYAGIHLENCPREGKGEGMIVKDVTVSQTPSGEGEGICLNMCVCRVSYRILSFGRGNSQISVLMWRGCIAHNN